MTSVSDFALSGPRRREAFPENKVDSLEQPDQVKDYLEHLRHVTRGRSIESTLIYLTPDGRAPKSLGPKLLNLCKKDKKLHCWNYRVELRAWLEICRCNCEAERIRGFFSDFIAYIECDLKRGPEVNTEEESGDEH